MPEPKETPKSVSDIESILARDLNIGQVEPPRAPRSAQQPPTAHAPRPAQTSSALAAPYSPPPKQLFTGSGSTGAEGGHSMAGASEAGPYSQLSRILDLAYGQSADGKGKERHSRGFVGPQPWENQPILVNARQVGPGGPALQVMKKTQEAVTMVGNERFGPAKAEILGAIVYAAALYKLVEEMEAHATTGDPE